MTDNNNTDSQGQQAFLRLLSEYQHRIYGFIMSLVGDWNETDDIYQETAGVLWKKVKDFEAGTVFVVAIRLLKMG